MKKYPTDHRPSFATSLSTIIPTTTRKTRTSNVHVLKLARGCNLHHSQRSQCQRFVFQEPLCTRNGKDDQVRQCIPTTHQKLEALVVHATRRSLQHEQIFHFCANDCPSHLHIKAARKKMTRAEQGMDIKARQDNPARGMYSSSVIVSAGYMWALMPQSENLHLIIRGCNNIRINLPSAVHRHVHTLPQGLHAIQEVELLVGKFVVLRCLCTRGLAICSTACSVRIVEQHSGEVRIV